MGLPATLNVNNIVNNANYRKNCLESIYSYLPCMQGVFKAVAGFFGLGGKLDSYFKRHHEAELNRIVKLLKKDEPTPQSTTAKKADDVAKKEIPTPTPAQPPVPADPAPAQPPVATDPAPSKLPVPAAPASNSKDTPPAPSRNISKTEVYDLDDEHFEEDVEYDVVPNNNREVDVNDVKENDESDNVDGSDDVDGIEEGEEAEELLKFFTFQGKMYVYLQDEPHYQVANDTNTPIDGLMKENTLEFIEKLKTIESDEFHISTLVNSGLENQPKNYNYYYKVTRSQIDGSAKRHGFHYDNGSTYTLQGAKNNDGTRFVYTVKFVGYAPAN